MNWNVIPLLVVSTVMFGSIFAAFHIVDYVPTARAFFKLSFCYVIIIQKKFQSRQKVLYRCVLSFLTCLNKGVEEFFHILLYVALK